MSKFRKSDTTESALHAVEEALKIDFKGGVKPSVAGVAQKVKRMATGTGAPTARHNPAAGEAADTRPGAEPPARQSARRRNGAAPAAPPMTTSAPSATSSTRCSAARAYTPFWVALFLSHRLGRPRPLLRPQRLGRRDRQLSAASRTSAPPRTCSASTIGIRRPDPALLGHRHPRLARPGDAHGLAHHDGSGAAARRAGEHRQGIGRHRQPGDPPRGRGDGRRHRARARARQRA